jgi:hypothetical protein
MLKSHPKAPWLRLVVNEDHPHLSAFGSGDLLVQLGTLVGRIQEAANSDSLSRLGF